MDLAPRQVALMRVIARLWLSVLRMILRFMSEMFTLQSEDLICCMPTFFFFFRQEFPHKWNIYRRSGDSVVKHFSSHWTTTKL